MAARAQPKLSIPLGGGIRKVGKPYQIAGKWYHPKVQPDYDERGAASWYGHDFHGKRTANGEHFDKWRLTAAHPTLPLPSLVRVTNLANGRTVLLRINDRGPYKRGRIIDLSRLAAQLLDFEHKGTTPVRVEYVGDAPLDGADHAERRHLAAQPWFKASDYGDHFADMRTRPSSAPARITTASSQ